MFVLLLVISYYIKYYKLEPPDHEAGYNVTPNLMTFTKKKITSLRIIFFLKSSVFSFEATELRQKFWNNFFYFFSQFFVFLLTPRVPGKGSASGKKNSARKDSPKWRIHQNFLKRVSCEEPPMLRSYQIMIPSRLPKKLSIFHKRIAIRQHVLTPDEKWLVLLENFHFWQSKRQQPGPAPPSRGKSIESRNLAIGDINWVASPKSWQQRRVGTSSLFPFLLTACWRHWIFC